MMAPLKQLTEEDLRKCRVGNPMCNHPLTATRGHCSEKLQRRTLKVFEDGSFLSFTQLTHFETF